MHAMIHGIEKIGTNSCQADGALHEALQALPCTGRSAIWDLWDARDLLLLCRWSGKRSGGR